MDDHRRKRLSREAAKPNAAIRRVRRRKNSDALLVSAKLHDPKTMIDFRKALAKAGTQSFLRLLSQFWIPAFAGTNG
jgi:hypothetical protein